jgi:hypothetical protein
LVTINLVQDLGLATFTSPTDIALTISVPPFAPMRIILRTEDWTRKCVIIKARRGSVFREPVGGGVPLGEYIHGEAYLLRPSETAEWLKIQYGGFDGWIPRGSASPPYWSATVGHQPCPDSLKPQRPT